MKIAEINKGGPTPCNRKSNRNREHKQRVNFPQLQRRLLSYIKDESAQGDGYIVSSMRQYSRVLGVSRLTAKNVLKDLENAGHIRIRSEFQDGVRRLRVTPKEH